MIFRLIPAPSVMAISKSSRLWSEAEHGGALPRQVPVSSGHCYKPLRPLYFFKQNKGLPAKIGRPLFFTIFSYYLRPFRQG